MSLGRVLKEIKKVKPLMDEDIAAGPRETYAGREGRQRNARELYRNLKEQYIEELRLTSTFIVVSGSLKEEFQILAKTEFNCFTADLEAFYKDLANRIPAELYTNKTSAANLFDIMGRHLEDKANEMGIVGYPQLIMRQQYQRALNGKEDFVKLIKQAINEQVGSEITGLNAVRGLTDQAIQENHDSKLTPIIMVTDDEDLALDVAGTYGRISSRVFLVAAGKGAKKIKTTEGAFNVKEVNSENVKNTLTNIAKLCKTR